MGEDASDFRAALVEMMDAGAATGPRPPGHPSADQWLAYQRGELPAGEEERLQEHLARCRDCFDLAEAAAAFAAADGEADPAEEDRAGADRVAAAALWRQVQPAAEGGGPAAGRAAPAAPPAPPRRSRGIRLPASLAAALFAALAGLAAWSLHQRSVVEELRAPRPADVLYLAAGERLPDAGEQTLAAGRPVVLVLNPEDERPVYRLAVRDAATGRQVFAGELPPDADLALNLYLPGLPAGRYKVEIGERTGRVLETHLLRVSGAGGGR